MNDIKLLPHQLKPVEYLVARCKTQHGLILNHYMGTGKTVTGLTFLKNYPKDKKTIIVPQGLETVWKSEANKFGILIKDITFITFDQLRKFESHEHSIKNSICIVDEAHNLYSVINSLESEFEDVHDDDSEGGAEGPKKKDDSKKKVKVKPRLMAFIDLMYSTKKILLLTGTLVRGRYWVNDMRWLINIAAGKENSVVPFDYSKFNDKYKKKTKLDKLWGKIIEPFLVYNPFNFIPKDVLSGGIVGDSNNIAEFLFTVLSEKAISAVLMKRMSLPVIDSKKGILDINRYKEIIMQIGKHATDIKVLRNMLFITILVKGLKLFFEYMKNYYEEVYEFSRLDVKKLLNDKVDRYFSYFNYKFIKTDDYPSIKDEIVKVNYTNKQLALLIKLIAVSENLTSQEYVSLELKNNIREAELFGGGYISGSKFSDKGRIIGNLYEEPEKFKRIVKIFRRTKEQTVVYSNFYESGLLLFSKYLRSEKIDHKIFDHSLSDDEKVNLLTDFKNKKVKLLLLHPAYYEGISIAGCRYLHVLEPIIFDNRREQLYARVVRYRSHSHLEKHKRNVKIYQWGCTLLYDLNKVLHTKEYVKQWLKSDNYNKSIISLFRRFDNFLSPDDNILSSYKIMKNFNEEFNKTIQAVNIDNSKIPLKCCIWTPEGSSCSDKKLLSCIE
jgi:hypothetical protein